jgi:hypothetical protein
MNNIMAEAWTFEVGASTGNRISRFKNVHKILNLHIVVVCVMMPCTLVDELQPFGGTGRLSLSSQNVQVVCSSETVLPIYQTTWCHNKIIIWKRGKSISFVCNMRFWWQWLWSVWRCVVTSVWLYSYQCFAGTYCLHHLGGICFCLYYTVSYHE